MDTLEFDHEVFSGQQAVADKALAVRFYMHPLRDESESEAKARPIYRDAEMIEVRVRGDRNNIVIREAREDDKRRFKQAYTDFKENRTVTATGTPLSEWPIMSASMVEEMKFFGFFTVEQLAEASEAALSKMPGLLTMKNRAKVFLQFAEGISPLEKLQADMERLKANDAARESSLAQAAKDYAALEKKYNGVLEKLASTETED